MYNFMKVYRHPFEFVQKLDRFERVSIHKLKIGYGAAKTHLI